MSDIKEDELVSIMNNYDSVMSDMIACKDCALEGLNILDKYTDKGVLVGANKEVIYSIKVSTAVENGITRAEVLRLKALNWMLEDESYFACFV